MIIKDHWIIFENSLANGALDIAYLLIAIAFNGAMPKILFIEGSHRTNGSLLHSYRIPKILVLNHLNIAPLGFVYHDLVFFYATKP